MIEALSAVLLVALVGGAWVVDQARTERTPVEAATAAYKRGEISLAELERRVELAMDPEAERIREAVEPINGVGPATSASIAEHFRSLEHLREAEPAEIEDVHGVGPSMAEAINQRLS